MFFIAPDVRRHGSFLQAHDFDMAEGDKKPPSDDSSLLRTIGTFSGIGFEFLVAIFLPGWLGFWLDGKFDLRPWLMLVGGAFGFGVGLYRMLKAANQAMR